MQKLTASTVKLAKQEPKAYKLWDGGGLYILVTAKGKYWRYDYRFFHKRKTLALGVYPVVSLKEARTRHLEARSTLARGVDPVELKRSKRETLLASNRNSFEVVAQEWLIKRGPKSEGGDKRLKRLLEKDLLPYLGQKPAGEIAPTDLLKCLQRIENRGAINTAHRAKQLAGMIFRFAVATGRAERDISVDLKDALATPTKTHFKTFTKPEEIGPLIATINAYSGTPVVTAALKLSPLLLCRPGELRQMEWAEVDLDKRIIELSASKMKMGNPHIIPLASQACEILEELYFVTGKSVYVFPSARGTSRPLSDNGVRTALRTLGYTNDQISPHGFRAMARTVLDEELHFRVDWIEHQLAHQVRDPNGRAYNRTKYLAQRKEMMQAWADYLEKLSKNTLKVDSDS